jgi:hypothetical protein
MLYRRSYGDSHLKAARIRLEHGEAVKNGKWIQDWAVLIYAIPLLFGRQSTSNWYEPMARSQRRREVTDTHWQDRSLSSQ